MATTIVFLGSGLGVEDWGIQVQAWRFAGKWRGGSDGYAMIVTIILRIILTGITIHISLILICDVPIWRIHASIFQLAPRIT